jgi:hypothetical protein
VILDLQLQRATRLGGRRIEEQHQELTDHHSYLQGLAVPRDEDS